MNGCTDAACPEGGFEDDLLKFVVLYTGRDRKNI